MKLFVISALVAVAAAGRLEHLERSYLPPDYEEYVPLSSSFESDGGFNSPNSVGSFGAFGASGLPSRSAGAFASATSNQYLPPDHGPSASNGAPQFAGSLQGFGGHNFHSQYRTPQAGSSFGAVQFPQPSAANRQYLAPHTSSLQNPPQQAFDEETGYHY